MIAWAAKTIICVWREFSVSPNEKKEKASHARESRPSSSLRSRQHHLTPRCFAASRSCQLVQIVLRKLLQLVLDALDSRKGGSHLLPNASTTRVRLCYLGTIHTVRCLSPQWHPIPSPRPTKVTALTPRFQDKSTSTKNDPTTPCRLPVINDGYHKRITILYNVY